MNLMLVTDWVKPPQGITGLDHLGVRAPCENLYTRLLPGITNVTDRARYYSFYPWLVWAFERHAGALRNQPFAQTVRRAECLLTLIGTRHSHNGGHRHLHNGLIGSLTLQPAYSGINDTGAIRLSEYATDDPSRCRYFKNKLGGLGQYYLGTLRDLGVLSGNKQEGVKYTMERGLALAEAFDAGVESAAFFRALEADDVSEGTLDELVGFCPCQIANSELEHASLLELFFNDQGAFHEADGESRRASLALILDLAVRLETVPARAEVYACDADLFRACVYAGALPGGEEWMLDARLARQRAGWHSYQRNELLSIAVQLLFWAGLDELSEQEIVLPHSEGYGEWFAMNFADALGDRADELFSDAVRSAGQNLPPIELWEDEAHEVQLSWSARYCVSDVEGRAAGVRAAVDLLIALAARAEVETYREGLFMPSPQHLKQHPINLQSFGQHASGAWNGSTLRELLRWLATTWGVQAHFRVALRKLHHDSSDTFRIKPTELGLVVEDDVPLPSFTNPRVTQALQILYDLNALAFDVDSGGTTVTALGRRLAEECRG